VYCCPRDQWLASTRQAIEAWSAHPGRPPAIVLRWDGYSGDLTRQTDRDLPSLREHLEAIGANPDPHAACLQLMQVLPEHVTNCAV
jgi:hypothetical protein